MWYLRLIAQAVALLSSSYNYNYNYNSLVGRATKSIWQKVVNATFFFLLLL
jgi:hypothetical protein